MQLAKDQPVRSLKKRFLFAFLVIAATLFLIINAYSNPFSRPSWEEQLRYLQQEMAKIAPDLELSDVYVSLPSYWIGRPEVNASLQKKPLLYLVSYANQQRDFGASVNYYDLTMTSNLEIGQGPRNEPIDSRLTISQPLTTVPLGPFDVYQQTITTALSFANADTALLNSSAFLSTGRYAERFALPAIWRIKWVLVSNQYLLWSKSHTMEETLHAIQGGTSPQYREVIMWVDPSTGNVLDTETALLGGERIDGK